MSDDAANAAWEHLSLMLNVCGAIAAITAVAASGSVAFLAGAAALICLAGSVANSLMPPENSCERYLLECGEQASQADAEEPAISQQPAQAEGKQWAASVKASKKACRSR